MKSKINLLKALLKEMAETRKQDKKAYRYNQSTFDKMVKNVIEKALKTGELKHTFHYPILPNDFYLLRTCEFYKQLNGKWEEQTQERKRITYLNVWSSDKDLVTAAHILYNRLRGKRSHLDDPEKEKRDRYVFLVDRWLEKLESLTKEESYVD